MLRDAVSAVLCVLDANDWSKEPNSDINAIRDGSVAGFTGQELLDENLITIQTRPSSWTFGDNSSERSLPDGEVAERVESALNSGEVTFNMMAGGTFVSEERCPDGE